MDLTCAGSVTRPVKRIRRMCLRDAHLRDHPDHLVNPPACDALVTMEEIFGNLTADPDRKLA